MSEIDSSNKGATLPQSGVIPKLGKVSYEN